MAFSGERAGKSHDAYSFDFMQQTSGRASLAGFDIFEQSLKGAARLVRMPKMCALYDMRFTEYLN